MKLRIMVLIGMAAAGVAASYALADRGHANGRDAYTSTGAQCQRVHVLGTVTTAPELTVTVTRAGEKSSLAPGDTVTVVLGSAGQSVRVNVEGCLATTTTGTTTDTTLTGKTAVLHAVAVTPETTTTDSWVHKQHGEDEHHATTTAATTDSTQSPTTTTTATSNP